MEFSGKRPWLKFLYVLGKGVKKVPVLSDIGVEELVDGIEERDLEAALRVGYVETFLWRLQDCVDEKILEYVQESKRDEFQQQKPISKHYPPVACPICGHKDEHEEGQGTMIWRAVCAALYREGLQLAMIGLLFIGPKGIFDGGRWPVALVLLLIVDIMMICQVVTRLLLYLGSGVWKRATPAMTPMPMCVESDARVAAVDGPVRVKWDDPFPKCELHVTQVLCKGKATRQLLSLTAGTDSACWEIFGLEPSKRHEVVTLRYHTGSAGGFRLLCRTEVPAHRGPFLEPCGKTKLTDANIQGMKDYIGKIMVDLNEDRKDDGIVVVSKEIQKQDIVESLNNAATVNDVGMIMQLLDAKAGVDADIDGEGRTALFTACKLGNIDAVTALVQRGANVHLRARKDASAQDWRYDDALTNACQFGCADTCRFLLEANAVVDIDTMSEFRMDGKWHSCNSLLAACMSGHAEVVLVLLKFRVNVNVRQKSGYGPLHCTVRWGREDCDGRRVVCKNALVVRALTSMPNRPHADVEMKDDNGWTPLLHAMVCKCAPCVRELFAAGAKYTHFLKQYGQQYDVFQAAKDDQLGTMMMLLQSMGDPNQCRQEVQAVQRTGAGYSNYSALCVAADFGRHTCAIALLDAKANPNQRCVYFDGTLDMFTTPLASAARNGSPELIRQLIIDSADLNLEIQPLTNFTALHAAAQAGQLSAIKVLHQSGSSLKLEASESGKVIGNALAVAEASKHTEVYRYLKAAKQTFCTQRMT